MPIAGGRSCGTTSTMLQRAQVVLEPRLHDLAGRPEGHRPRPGVELLYTDLIRLPVRDPSGAPHRSRRRAHHPARPRAGRSRTPGCSPPAAPYARPQAIRLDQPAVRRHPAPHPLPGLDRQTSRSATARSSARCRSPTCRCSPPLHPRLRHRCPINRTRRETRLDSCPSRGRRSPAAPLPASRLRTRQRPTTTTS